MDIIDDFTLLIDPATFDPELFELCEQKVKCMEIYERWYAGLSPENKRREDERALAASVGFVVDGPGGP